MLSSWKRFWMLVSVKISRQFTSQNRFYEKKYKKYQVMFSEDNVSLKSNPKSRVRPSVSRRPTIHDVIYGGNWISGRVFCSPGFREFCQIEIYFFGKLGISGPILCQRFPGETPDTTGFQEYQKTLKESENTTLPIAPFIFCYHFATADSWQVTHTVRAQLQPWWSTDGARKYWETQTWPLPSFVAERLPASLSLGQQW